MLLFTGHTALEYWRWVIRTVCVDKAIQEKYDPDSQSVPLSIDYIRRSMAPEVTPGLREARFESDFFRNSLPIETMVAHDKYKNHQEGIRCFVRPQRFPARSFCRINKTTYVVSPELLFLESAIHMDFLQLLLLGYELTAKHVIDTTDIRGICKSKPLITAEKLQTYLAHFDRYKGLDKARKAADLVSGKSASPMETRLAILLTLPRRLGGFGLPKPVMNHRIAIDSDKSQGFNKGNLEFDLFWKKGNLAVEYDSDLFHSSDSKIGDDSAKRNAALRHGYKVITVTKDEFADINRMEDIARNISRVIGFRLPAMGIKHRSEMIALKKRLM